MRNVVDLNSFPSQKEHPMAIEVLSDTISKFRYMLHIMFSQEDKLRERVNTFGWQLQAAQLRPYHIVFNRSRGFYFFLRRLLRLVFESGLYSRTTSVKSE